MRSFLVFVFLLVSIASKADEGMWLPHLLGKQKYAEMKAKGLKLTSEQIYNINQSSIKDAIVMVSTGCSGEIVSANGLLFTNHHCVYDALSEVSAAKAKDGYYASNANEEIPLPGVWVLFLVKVQDVTKQVEDSMKLYSDWNTWQTKKQAVFQNIQHAADSGTMYTSFVYSMFKENQFLLFTYEQYADIRLVGIPPASMGNFGGETDNWEYPRHAADFAVLRVYTSAQGKPAKYQASNIPFKPKYVLPISLKGYKENDFTMTLGYPGNTQRYQTSYGVRLTTDFVSPSFVHMRDIRLDAMMDAMKKDSAVKTRLASEYASIANYWKYYNGEAKLSKKHMVYENKKKQEDALATWMTSKPEYTDLFRKYERTYSAWVPYARHKEYYDQGIMGVEVVNFANELEEAERLLLRGTGKDLNKELARLDSLRNILLQQIDLKAEQQMLQKIVQSFHDEIAVEQQPVMFYNLMKQGYGSLKDPETYKLWVEAAFEKSLIVDDKKWKTFIQRPDAGTLQNDPLYFTAFSFRENWKKYRTNRQAFTESISSLDHQYLKAITEMNAGKALYPDANASMRISYGNIKGYERDTTMIPYFCTATELLKKYKPGDLDFDLPSKTVELLQSKDFGRYADPLKKDMLVSFVSTDDQTGGSSGSPLLNASGQVIGISHDANGEALANRFMYDKTASRTINVDIRYVLWCIDKLAGCSYIMKELLVK